MATPREETEGPSVGSGVCVSARMADPVSALVSQTDDVERTGKVNAPDQLTTLGLNTESILPPQATPAVSTSPRGSWTEQFPGHAVVTFVATEVATFYDVFGLLGVPMILVFLVSAAWTFILAAIQIHGTTVANTIMNTTQFDNGEFWLLPQQDTSLVVSSIVLLSIFGIGYTALAVIMIFFHRFGQPDEVKQAQDTPRSGNGVPADDAATATNEAKGTKLQRLRVWIYELPHDIREHYFTAALDLPKLIFQTLTLYTYLRKGFPTAIIYYYSVLLLCNWLVTCYRSQRYVSDPDLIIARLYYTFDLFFAVFAPLVVLIYFIYTFKFDRAEFLTRIESINPGSFDIVARIFGDPSQISSFCSAFHYLQFSSGTALFYKSALNVLSIYKWRKIIMTLIHNHHERQLERKRKALIKPVARESRTGSIKAAITKRLSETLSKPKFGRHFVAKLFLSLVFFVAGVCMFIYSVGSVQSTVELCSKYEKCVIPSYQWNFNEEHCTCLVFVDRETSPTKYSDWIDPPDTTSNLAALAIAGELRIAQIINRAVPELPEELKNCRYIEQLILVYTKTTALPAWLAEFTHLEYFHLEGDYTSRRLTTIADGIFDNMPHLTFLHFGGIPNVEKLPSLSSLKRLRYLTLAVLDSLKELPSFEGLSKLDDLDIVHALRAPTLPSLAPLTGLKSLVIRARMAVCCNGFITGTCNMTESQCLPISGEKYPLTCTDERISAEDKAVLNSFGSAICPSSPPLNREAMAPSKYTTDELCNGVKYRECTLNGKQGICFNTRMMVIQCETTSGYIAMRKLQIQRGVGDACDPEVEAWLGCS